MEVMSTVSKDEKDKTKWSISGFYAHAIFDILKQLFDDKIVKFLAFVFCAEHYDGNTSLTGCTYAETSFVVIFFSNTIK